MRCRACKTKCFQNKVARTSGKSEEYESTKKWQGSVRGTCRIRSTRSPCMFSRRRYNKKEEVTVGTGKTW